MENKDYQPILPADEKPEEGFVPYCGSEEAKELGEKKPRSLYKTILAILGVLALVVFAVLLIGNQFNLYHSVLKSLRFDYRSGEETLEDTSLEKGACARAVSEKIGKKQITAEVAMYLLDEKAVLMDAVSEVSYLHSSDTDLMTIKAGSKRWLFPNKTEIKLPLKEGYPPITQEYNKPLLSELMFGSASHGAYYFEVYDAYRSSVNGQQYICEVWLLADASLSEPSYYTLYRYYQDEKLAGLRVMSDRDSVMEVYDIKSYTIG